MEYKKSFWNSEAVKDMYYDLDNAEQVTVQPHIAKIINDNQPKTMLDYGCGDAFLATLIEPNTKISLHDKNLETLQQTYDVLTKHQVNCEMLIDEKEIKSNYYDVINLGLVLVCVESETERNAIIKKLFDAKKENGILIYTLTHPCFRQYENVAFRTDFEKDKFDYFNQGKPYQVTMKSEGQEISFTDYHYTLSHNINTFLKNGFRLEQMIELPDYPYKNRTPNQYVSPFMIMIFK